MNILVLTSIYPADDLPKTYTPVVHYFTKEWVRQGHCVRVVHSASVFPRLFYWLARRIGVARVASKVGSTVPERRIEDRNYEWEGIPVARHCIQKIIPHGRFSGRAIQGQVRKIIEFCKRDNFVPELIVGHWMNPQLELLVALRESFPSARTALTLHEKPEALKALYFRDWDVLLHRVDKIGARNRVLSIKNQEELSIERKNAYVCQSGIPDVFLDSDELHCFSDDRNRYIFVGTLFERKYPEAILKALILNQEREFSVTYIGAGEQEREIHRIVQEFEIQGCVHLLGRMPREQIKSHLRESDVFVMISRDEVYGLVYLEAMAQGCITIAARNEGFDGIIEDGVNGFLCEAGNVSELASILTKIKSLSGEDLACISRNAQEAARSMSDSICAKKYLKALVG